MRVDRPKLQVGRLPPEIYFQHETAFISGFSTKFTSAAAQLRYENWAQSDVTFSFLARSVQLIQLLEQIFINWSQHRNFRNSENYSAFFQVNRQVEALRFQNLKFSFLFTV